MGLTKDQIEELLNDRENTLFGISFSDIQKMIYSYQARGVDPWEIGQLRQRVVQLEHTVRELLMGGEHEGDCTNDFEEGPCWNHCDAADRRATEARKVLGE